MKYLIVGAGLSGATFARKMKDLGHEPFVVEQRSHIGGNVYDHYTEGLYRHEYGPHLFHTNSGRVVDFLSRFTQWVPHTHKVKSEVHGQLVDMPVNLRTVEQLYPPEQAQNLQRLLIQAFGFNSKVSLDQLNDFGSELLKGFAEFVSKNMVENYSRKAWGTDVFKLDAEVLKRIPVRVNYDDRYFEDKFQAQPRQGFTAMVTKMLDGIPVELDTEFSMDMVQYYDRVFFTGEVDRLFGHEYGPLPYRGLDFHWEKALSSRQQHAVVNHPDHMHFTRTTNFSFMHADYKQERTWFCSEAPREYDYMGDDIPYYPVRNDKSRDLYHQYAKLAVEKHIILGGRLGRFEYLNMDQAVAQALMLADKERDQ